MLEHHAPAAHTAGWSHAFARRTQLRGDAELTAILAGSPPGVLSMTGGFPNPKTLPTDVLDEIAARLLRDDSAVAQEQDVGEVRGDLLDVVRDEDEGRGHDVGGDLAEAGDEVYVGQIVGQHVRVEDIDVNVCKEKALRNMRASSSDRKMVVAPARKFGVEEALEFIEDDELVEVTPKSVRMRKRILDEKKRRRERTREKLRDGTFVE